MSLFDHGKEEDKSGIGRPAPTFDAFHPIDDAKKLINDMAGIMKDIRKMVDKAARAMKILGE